MIFFLKIFLFLSLSLSQSIEKIYYTVKLNNLTVGNASLEYSLVDDKSHKILFNLKTKKWLEYIYKLREKITIIVDSENYAIKSITKKSNTRRKKVIKKPNKL